MMEDTNKRAITEVPVSLPYWQEHIPKNIIEKLESGAFINLCSHLKERSNEVQNIDLMALSGFCRNCLAKWMVLEARKLSDEMRKNNYHSNTTNTIMQGLNSFGYEEAAEYIYGMEYSTWKNRYNKKATEEQMEKYNDSKSLQAQHDKELLKTRTTERKQQQQQQSSSLSNLLASNVCCMDIDEAAEAEQQQQQQKYSTSASNVSFVPPAIPKDLKLFHIYILTISDRASKGQYETGDLSGPAVQQSIEELFSSSSSSGKNKYHIVTKDIVPDNEKDIIAKIKEWSHESSGSTNKDDNIVKLIFTTGSTGFSLRDVAPEATKKCIDKECCGLMSFVLNECSAKYNQPLAQLSRGTCGIINNNDTTTNPHATTIIANLPGNPKSAFEIMPILLPLVLYVIQDLQQQQK